MPPSRRSRAVRCVVGVCVVGMLLAGSAASADPLGEISVVATAGVTSGFTTANGEVYSLTTGPDDLLWFTEGFQAVARLNADGTVDEFTSGITGGSLQSITPGPDGNLWFAEFNPPAIIGRITPDGTITEMAVFGVTPNFTNGNVQDIAAGPDGNLWFTKPFNSGQGVVGRITPAGVVTEFTPPNADAQPRSIVTGPDGRLWYTDSGGPGRVMTVSTAGDFEEMATGGVTPDLPDPSYPGDLALGPDDALWFRQGIGAVGRLTVEGDFTQFDNGDLEETFGQIVSACGDLWLTTGGQGGTSAVWRLTTEGDFTDYTDGIPAGGPDAITLGADGNVYAGVLGDPSSIVRVGTGTGCDQTEPTTTTTPAAVTPIAASPALAVATTPAFTG
jgi:streptogramin lyase